MKVDMIMPQMGESIAEGTIVKWLKNIGDSIEKDEIILEISTDKVDSEIPAPSAGPGGPRNPLPEPRRRSSRTPGSAAGRRA